MKNALRQFLFPLRAGTRSLMALFGLLYVLQIIGERTGAYDLIASFALYPKSIWSGQVWRLFSYAFVTPSLALFVINILYIGMLGNWLERIWSPRQWWTYCLICILAPALTKVAISPFSSIGFISNLGLTFGLLAAWGRLFAHEDVLLMGIWKMTIRNAAIAFGIINFLLILPCGGWLNALILLTGGMAGWLYISMGARVVHLRESHPIDSARISRLEL